MSRILDIDDFAAYGLMMGVFDNVVSNSTDDSNTIYDADSPGDVVPGISTVNSLYPFGFTVTTGLSYVEYTFGYKRNSDGKVRICLHHSSIPYEPGNLKEVKGVFRMKQTTIIDPAQADPEANERYSVINRV